MPHRGWVKDWRMDEDFCLHPLNRREPFTKYEAYKDMVKLANHEARQVPFEGSYYPIERGQFLTSQVKLAKRWKWSQAKVRRFLQQLQKLSEVDFKTTTLCTVITICKYDTCQSTQDTERLTDDYPANNERITSDDKQELKELEQLKETTTKDFVEKKVNEIRERYIRHGLDPDTAIEDIYDYILTHDIPHEKIGPLVYRWPEHHKKETTPKKQETVKDYGPAGARQI